MFQYGMRVQRRGQNSFRRLSTLEPIHFVQCQRKPWTCLYYLGPKHHISLSHSQSLYKISCVTSKIQYFDTRILNLLLTYGSGHKIRTMWVNIQALFKGMNQQPTNKWMNYILLYNFTIRPPLKGGSSLGSKFHPPSIFSMVGSSILEVLILSTIYTYKA